MVTRETLKVQLIAKREAGPSGTSRYLAGIQQSLLEVGVQVDLTYPAPPPVPGPLLSASRRLGVDLATFFSSCPLRARLHSADIYHIPVQTMATLLCFQRFPAPVVVTVLDIIPYLVSGHRELDTQRHPVERLFYRLALAGLKRADVLIAISEYTKRTLVEVLGLSEERIQVVAPAVNHDIFHPSHIPERFRAQYGLGADGRYVLYVGSDDPRKNLRALLRALSLVRRQLPSVKLLLVGTSQFPEEHRALVDLVQTLGLGRHVKFVQQVSDEELPLFYNLAEVVAIPALYEGFGLPVAEAMACGTPVVCSNATSLPEVAGSAALLVSPHNPDEIAAALLRTLTNPDLADELRRKGLVQAASFSPGRSTKGLVQAYAAATGSDLAPRERESLDHAD